MKIFYYFCISKMVLKLDAITFEAKNKYAFKRKIVLLYYHWTTLIIVLNFHQTGSFQIYATRNKINLEIKSREIYDFQ